jgi:hypothetical protein
MRRLLLALSIAAGAIFPAVASDKFVLNKGDLRHNTSGWPEQVLSLKNNSDQTVSVSVECGFYKGENLIDTDGADFINVRPGQLGYSHINTGEGDADRTDCRISNVIPGEDF